MNSDYASGSTGFSAKVDPDSFVPINPDKEGGGVSAWIIVLCVLMGVALLGGGGYWLYKKKL